MENYNLILNDNIANTLNITQQKELAVLFLDIHNFTGLAESQPAQMIIDVVQRFFTAFNRIVKEETYQLLMP